MKSLLGAAAIVLIALSSAAFAQSDEGNKAAKDLGRMICKSEGQTGSRIAKKKVCMTAVQWKEQRRLSRMEISRSQANRFKSRPSDGI